MSGSAAYDAQDAERYAATREKRNWRGVQLHIKDGIFYVNNSWYVKDQLRSMGFKWNRDSKPARWETQDNTIAARIIDHAFGSSVVDRAPVEVRNALRNHIRMIAAEGTYQRAAAKLAAGDVDTMRGRLTPAVATAIRAAIASLTLADSDKATIVNGKGFSKADTELGHTLALTGIRTYREAAISMRLLGRYRKQLPQDILDVVFPVYDNDLLAVVGQFDQDDAVEADLDRQEMDAFINQASDDEHTMSVEEAQAVVEFFDTDDEAAMQQLCDRGVFLDGQDTIRCTGIPDRTTTRIAAVEGGQGLYYIEQDGGSRHWLEVS